MMRPAYYLLASRKKAKTCQIMFRYYGNFAMEAKTKFGHIKRGNYSVLDSTHLEYFRSVLGTCRVLSNLEEIETYNTDFSNQLRGNGEVVLKPKTTDEVSCLLKYCNDNNLAVCPQGGNTGLVYGSTPLYDEIIISTELMNNVIGLDEISGSLTCQAGCVLETLDNYLQEYNLMMPLDLGSKGTCQIGGNLSTNAGGLRLLRSGNLHGSVSGLEVVLANGCVVDLMNTMKKDNTGYHLKNLFIGAEGTLGIITKVAIQCPPLLKSITVSLLGLDSFENVLTTFKEAKENLGEILSACEIMDDVAFDKTIEVFNISRPLSVESKFYIVLETRSGLESNSVNRLNNFIETLLSRGICVDGYVTDEPTKSRKIWEIRENVAIALFKTGFVYKYDVSVPLKNFYTLVEQMEQRLKGTSALLVTGFGHLGDGNLHLNVCSKEYEEEIKNLIEPFIFEEVYKLGGSISAEHGIGLEKSQYLYLSKSEAAINLMREVKQLFDPKGILNPYKILPQ